MCSYSSFKSEYTVDDCGNTITFKRNNLHFQVYCKKSYSCVVVETSLLKLNANDSQLTSQRWTLSFNLLLSIPVHCTCEFLLKVTASCRQALTVEGISAHFWKWWFLLKVKPSWKHTYSKRCAPALFHWTFKNILKLDWGTIIIPKI